MKTQRSEIALVFCADERYFPGLFCTIGSALMSLADGVPARLHVIDAGINLESRRQLGSLVARWEIHTLEFIESPQERFNEIPQGRYHQSTYFRIALPDLLSIPRVIYLDADLVITDDLSSLWEKFDAMSDCLGAVADWETHSMSEDAGGLGVLPPTFAANGYFNSGVMLLDLDGMRSRNVVDRAIALLEAEGEDLRFPDQSALNFIMNGKWLELAKHWNTPAWAFDREVDRGLPGVIHYTNGAPWLRRQWRPSQALFERLAHDLSYDLPKAEVSLFWSVLSSIGLWCLAPLRVVRHCCFALLCWRVKDSGEAAQSFRIAKYWNGFFWGGVPRILRYFREIRHVRTASIWAS